MARSVEALIDEIDLLASRGLPRKEFFAELAPRVRTVVDNDASCWHTLDPHTRLLTSDDPAELIGRGIFTPEQAPGAGELIIRSEYMIDDVNTFAGLAAKRVPVGILDHATRGNPESSPRYRDLLLPSDIPHELRAAFVDPRARVGRCPHRPPRVERTVPTNRTPTPSPRSPARSRVGSARRCASTRLGASTGSRRPASSSSAPATRWR